MISSFFPSFCVNFPEILRWKDLGCATASPKAGEVGGGGAGGASSDFAVMDLAAMAHHGHTMSIMSAGITKAK